MKCLILLLSAAAALHAQIISAGAGAQTGGTQAISITPGLGELLVLGVACNSSTAAITSVSSNFNNDWHLACGPLRNTSANASSLWIYYNPRTTVATASNITAATTNCATQANLVVRLTGADPVTPFDLCGAGATGNGTAGNAGSITPTYAATLDEAIVAVGIGRGASNTISSGVNYTNRASAGSSSTLNRIIEDRMSVPAGAQTAGPFTMGAAMDWSGLAAAFHVTIPASPAKHRAVIF